MLMVTVIQFNKKGIVYLIAGNYCTVDKLEIKHEPKSSTYVCHLTPVLV